MGIAFMTLSMVVYTVHMACQDIDGGATEADGRASAPVGPSVVTSLTIVHGIDLRVWSTKSGPWTIVHGIYIQPSMDNGKWTMDYSPWYRHTSMANQK